VAGDVEDPLNHGQRGEGGQQGEHRQEDGRHERGGDQAEAQGDDALWALEDADVRGLLADAFGPRAGVAHHQRADDGQIRQYDADGVGVRLIPPHQAQKHAGFRVPVTH
jgi:hypothetical protein